MLISNNNIKGIITCMLMLMLHWPMVSQTVNVGELVIVNETTVGIVSAFDNTNTASFVNDGDVYVFDDWNNDGSVDFLEDTGMVRFVGDEPQVIKGIEFSYFFDVFFDNRAAQIAFELSGAISVANESTFENGVIDTKNFGGEFVFEPGSNHFSTNDFSYVDGDVTKIGDDFFVFPSGDAGHYRIASVDAIDSDSAAFTCAYFFEDVALKYPVVNVDGNDNIILMDNTEYWDINRVSGTSEVMVSLSWNLETTPSEIVVEPYEAIHVVRWDDLSQKWVDEGGMVDSINNTVTATVSGYGIFTLARVDSTDNTPDIDLPTVFTPNNDGVNDMFEIPELLALSQNFNMRIINRYGNTVYHFSHNVSEDSEPKWWDGYSSGAMTLQKNKLLPTGVYYYTITIEDGKTKPITGWVYLNR